MERGLYIAASGMIAEQIRQDQIANDLANASTPGYKPDWSVQRSFEDVLLQNSQTGQPVGTLSMGAHIAREVVDLAQGPLQNTGEPLNVALQGAGFFVVGTAAGNRYTRDGQFVENAAGQLTTDTGEPVLGTDGRPISIAAAKSAGDVSIASDGRVTVRGKLVGTLAVVSLANPAKLGGTLFSGTPGGKPAGTTVEQGYLEGSGVNPVTTMVEMMTSFQSYQASQRAIQTLDTELGRAVTSVGSASGQ